MRGQSAVLGLVILIGIVAISSVGILVLADSSISNMQQQTENERAEQSFVELSQSMGTMSSTNDISRSLDLAVGENGAVTKEDSGWIRIESDALNNPVTIPIGSIEYEGNDGTIVAYQAGGVFRETGNETQIISPPPIHYDLESRSLTFPITTVKDGQNLDSGGLSLSHSTTTTYEEAAVLEDEHVTITVQSEFYRGWESYFETQAGNSVVKEVDHDTETLTVQLGYDELETVFDTGVIHMPGGLDDFCSNECTVGDDGRDGIMRPLVPVIDDMIDDAKTGSMAVDTNLSVVNTTYTDDDQLSDGTYFAERIEQSGKLEFDLSEGNATLVVENNIDAGEDAIVVSDWEEGNTLKIYTGGDLYAHGDGDICVEPCHEDTTAEVIQVFGTPTMGVDFGTGGSPRFEGLLYAASEEEKWGDRAGQCGNDVQVCAQSNPSIYGSIVAASIDFHSGAEFEYDTNLDDSQISLYPEEYTLPPPITYLNIARHEIDVKNN